MLIPYESTALPPRAVPATGSPGAARAPKVLAPSRGQGVTPNSHAPAGSVDHADGPAAPGPGAIPPGRRSASGGAAPVGPGGAGA